MLKGYDIDCHQEKEMSFLCRWQAKKGDPIDSYSGKTGRAVEISLPQSHIPCLIVWVQIGQTCVFIVLELVRFLVVGRTRLNFIIIS